MLLANKSVAVSGVHIPSYNNNRWAILIGRLSSCLCHLSLCLSVHSTAVFPSLVFQLGFFFLFPLMFYDVASVLRILQFV